MIFDRFVFHSPQGHQNNLTISHNLCSPQLHKAWYMFPLLKFKPCFQSPISLSLSQNILFLWCLKDYNNGVFNICYGDVLCYDRRIQKINQILARASDGDESRVAPPILFLRRPAILFYTAKVNIWVLDWIFFVSSISFILVMNILGWFQS